MSCSESTIAIYPWQQFIKLSLTKNQVKPLVIQRKKKDYQRYERPTPGDWVQMDTCKIAPGIYQYTAVDDCSRYRVLSVFKRRSAANTLLFLDQVLEETPFPIQRIQTDRGTEFFAEKVQLKMMEYGIKFRPNKPGSPHLNGKVERSQRTDKEEFYSTIKLDLHELQTKTLPEWQHYYNWQRAHGSFKGKTQMDVVCEHLDKIPIWEDVSREYKQDEERIQLSNYQRDLQLRKLEPTISMNHTLEYKQINFSPKISHLSARIFGIYQQGAACCHTLYKSRILIKSQLLRIYNTTRLQE
jgi:transposase-like protein